MVRKPKSKKKPWMMLVRILLNLGYKASCSNHLKTFNSNLHAVDISRQFQKHGTNMSHVSSPLKKIAAIASVSVRMLK